MSGGERRCPNPEGFRVRRDCVTVALLGCELPDDRIVAGQASVEAASSSWRRLSRWSRGPSLFHQIVTSAFGEKHTGKVLSIANEVVFPVIFLGIYSSSWSAGGHQGCLMRVRPVSPAIVSQGL